MKIERISASSDLVPLANSWNVLAAGAPFLSSHWLHTWWRHFGSHGSLYVLTVRDAGGDLVGIAPWWLDVSAAQGRVIRFLGCGEVCTDYLSLLVAKQQEDQVIDAIARWLTDAAAGRTGNRNDAWDLMHVEGIAAHDSPMTKLIERLAWAGNRVRSESGTRCWRIALPESWDEYLAMMSKSHRKQVRRVERRLLDSGRAVLKTACQPSQLDAAMSVLVDLHQRRRRSLNEPGCFSSPRFHRFLHEAANELAAAGRLRVHWIELDGQAVAAEFHVCGNGVTYAYQAGVDPEQLDAEPGRIINIATIKAALSRGDAAFDFLRGDEPYKAHWRAEPQPMLDVRVVPSRASAHLRHGMWLAGTAVKHWVKSSLGMAHS